eukprot:TRINITY_DN6081_c0_g1_i1.p1 TRINITY_DN6081_c0_g1~~TRINITY_DN6081_c0_g1_i1.p1  ORF type:complete len:409 (+),score=186.47 TRINITY_DN6081_c0_g1_i1:129-1355(+)
MCIRDSINAEYGGSRAPTIEMVQTEAAEQQERQLTWGKKLAHNDKKVRDKTVKVLRQWLSKMPNMSDLDFLKLWKGLFYCFWMSDKRPVQRELAENIASLVASCHQNSRLAFIKGFFVTMLREWSGIDRLRLDKYFVLLEVFLEASFAALHGLDWDEEVVDTFVADMEQSVLSPKETGGMSMFVMKKWLPKLRAASSEVPMEALGKLLEPFLGIVAASHDKHNVKLCVEHVFEPLLPNKMSDEETLVADIPEMVDLLFQLASSRETREANRKGLYALHEQFERCLNQLAAMHEENEENEEDEEDEEEDDIEDMEDAGDSDVERAVQAARDAFGSEEDEDEDEDEEEESEEEPEPEPEPVVVKKKVVKKRPAAKTAAAKPAAEKKQPKKEKKRQADKQQGTKQKKAKSK